VGKLTGLYPADDLQALYCDEVTGAFEDINNHIVHTFGLEGQELKAAREKLIEKRLSVLLPGIDALLTRGGGKYFAGNQLTVADLKSFVQTRSLCSGILDHIPTDIVQQFAPGLLEHQTRIGNEPAIVAYYASRKP
jgi:prostaglandin-H2 D-isomerase / glutathione transferase